MYGLTRATITLLAAGVAGFLIWLAARGNDHSTGDYWLDYGLIALAGLVMAFSQLLGGWTKWGWPRVSASVFLWAFVPVAIVVLWIVIYHQPHGGWFRHHIRSWSSDIHVGDLVSDVRAYQAVLAFGVGLVLGYTFDTTGPLVERRWGRRRAVAPGAGAEAAPPVRETREGARVPPAEPVRREGPPTNE